MLIRWWFVAIALLGLSSAAPPVNVSLRWTTATTAVMSWDQQSDATWVCVNGWDADGIGIFRQCEDTVTGAHSISMTPERVTVLQYYDIVEWVGPPDARTLYGQYQSYVLYRERVLLPLLNM